MGGQPSTRRVTLDNEEPALITVSSNVVERLNSRSKSSSDPPPKTKAKEHEEPPSRTRSSHSKSHIDVGHLTYAGDELRYKGLPYVTTKEIEKAIEEEIQKNTVYWEKRLARQQEINENMNKVLEEEYFKASEQMEKYLPKMSQNDKSRASACEEKSQQIMNCFQKNKQQPLVCSSEVKAFTSCMMSTRVN